MRKVFSYVLIFLTVIAVIALLFLVGLLVVKLFSTNDVKLLSTNDPTVIGTLVTGIVTAFGIAVAILAGFYAKGQLKTAQATTQWDFVLRFDERFRAQEHLDTYTHGMRNEMTARKQREA